MGVDGPTSTGGDDLGAELVTGDWGCQRGGRQRRSPVRRRSAASTSVAARIFVGACGVVWRNGQRMDDSVGSRGWTGSGGSDGVNVGGTSGGSVESGGGASTGGVVVGRLGWRS